MKGADLMKRKIISASVALTMILSASIFFPHSQNVLYAASVETIRETAQEFKIRNASCGKVSANLFWNGIPCDGYNVYMMTSGGYFRLASVNGNVNAYTVKNLAPSTEYTFKISAFRYDGERRKISFETSPDFTLTTKEAPPSNEGFTSAEISKNVVRLNWKKVRCDGYRIYMLGSSGTWRSAKTIESEDINSYLIRGLEPLTTYTFRLRAFNYDNNGRRNFGKYSEDYVVTTKTAAVRPETVSGISASADSGSAVLSWNGVKCDGYEVYMLQCGSWNLAKRISDGKTSCKINLPDSSGDLSFKVRAYNLNEKGDRIAGGYSKTVNVKTGPLIEVRNGITYVDGILIANKTYSLPEGYAPGGLTTKTVSAFREMQNAAAKDGISLWIVSGYRSYGYQSTLYSNYVWRDGKAAADRYSARPGHSEHQTGLAIDVNNASSSFNNTAEAKWLAAHCDEYGFIIRYPQGKESVTGFKYEPWHVRYLGKDLAKKVTDSGLTLEEYLGIDSVYKK